MIALSLTARTVAECPPGVDALAVDVLVDGVWGPLGMFAVRERVIEAEAERFRCAFASRGAVPHGAPAGVTSWLLSDWVEVEPRDATPAEVRATDG